MTTAERWQKQGIKLVLYDISSEPVYDSPVAKMFFNILAAVANFERERIHERIEAGRRGKASKGGHLGGRAPYGYQIDGVRATSRLVANPDEQAVVRMIRERAKQADASARSIAAVTESRPVSCGVCRAAAKSRIRIMTGARARRRDCG